MVKVCDRHRGLGGDGVLEPVSSERADVGVGFGIQTVPSPKSGNGLRILLGGGWFIVGNAHQELRLL